MHIHTYIYLIHSFIHSYIYIHITKKRIGTTLCREGLKSCSVPAQESTCTGRSEVCQWLRGELGESFVVRWDQNPALWHQLNSVLGGGGMLSMTPRTPSPLSNMEVETLCFGGVSAKGTGQLPRIKGTMDGAMYRQGQGIENWSWMGIPAWQWPKTHGQGNKGEAQEEAH